MIFLLPLAASAAVAAAPAAVATASVGATITSIATNLAMNVAISSAMSALQPKVGGSGRMSDWMLDEDSPIPFPAGRVGVSGAAVYQKTFGPDLMYKGVVSVLAGAGPIDGYESFKADEELVTFDGNGKAISSQYAGELWLKRTLGAQPDVALSSPAGLKNGSTMSGWSAAHKLSGKAAAMHVMGENSKYTAFPTGEIKGLHVLRGLKGWDPRLDSTYPGGLGACRLNNPATWVYITNPIIWGLKWSLGLWEGPTLKGAPAHGSETDFQVGGIGAKLSGIDVPAFVSAANIADANGWTVSGYPTTDDDKHEVLKSFLQAGGAVYAQRAGKISCISRAAPRASIVTITGADTAGELQLDTGASRIDRINTIRPRVISEAHNWQLTAIPKVSAQSYRDADGGTRPRGLDYTYVSKPTQGAQLAALEIANTREPMAGIVPLMPWLQKIKPGDAFEIDDPDFVLNGLKCLCLNTEFDPSTKSVMVTFVSETDAKYPFALGQTSVPPVPPALTPETHEVTPPQLGEWNLAAVDLTDGGVSVPILLFTGDVDNARAESVIFEYRPVGAADWSFAGSDDPTVVRKEGGGGTLTAGTSYEGAVSYRSGGRISTRLILGPVIAGTLTAGDVAPIVPANIAGTPTISITTTMSPDGTATSRLWGDWADAANAETYVVELSDGLITTPIEVQNSGLADLIVQIGGTYRYRVKGKSRTGHVSAAWSNWSVNQLATGDSTAPGPVGVIGGPGNGVFPLVRQVGMAWANPVVSDLARVLIYRNASGTSPQATGEAPYGWSEGTRFFDGQATLGTTYHYWALTQDRSGNVSWASLVYLGSGQARRVSVASDDVLATDPLLVTGYGIAGGIAGQGPGATAPANRVLNDRIENGINYVQQPDGGTLAFSGPQTGAIQIVLPWGAGSTSMIKFDVFVSDLSAGRMNTKYTVSGYMSLGQGDLVGNQGWGQSFATMVGPRGATLRVRFGFYADKGYIWIGEPNTTWYFPSVRVENVEVRYSGAALNWTTGWNVSMNAGDVSALTAFSQIPRPGDAVFGEGVLESPTGAIATRANFRTDQGISSGIAGQSRFATAATLSLLDSDIAAPFSALDAVPVRLNAHPVYGANYLDADRMLYGNSYSVEQLRPGEAGANITEGRISSGIAGQGPGATAAANRVLNDRMGNLRYVDYPDGGDYQAPSYVNGQIQIVLPYGAIGVGAYAMLRFKVDIYDYNIGQTVSYEIGGYTYTPDNIVEQWVNVAANYVGPRGFARPVKFGFFAGKGYIWIGNVGDSWAYASVRVHSLQVGYSGANATGWASGWSVTLNNTNIAGLVTAIVSTPRAGDQVFGEGLLESPAGTVATRSNFRTDQGIANGIAGQTAWATHSASVQRIQYLDDAGRIIDGRGLPLNAASGAGLVLDPTAPLSPGSNTSTQIAVAATTVTLVGGQTINIAASTISGLTQNTAYAVFYDLLTSSCIAISSAATAYYTSANRYLALGYHRTALSGGTYSPPPAPPPWGGGGIGNCADEDAMILMADPARMGPGEEKRFGDVRRGDHVWTQHELTGQWGAFEVEAISLAKDEPCCLLTVDDGRTLPVTPDHRVSVEGRGYVHAKDLLFGAVILGPQPSRLIDRTYAGRRTVVRATIREAHTYVANGMLSHNIKYVEP
ncbi:MAG: Hint domain-containing protein [Pseudomonadota bacterium]|nr:Hint domain-containing protein [Pseudomonadota bacterium]